MLKVGSSQIRTAMRSFFFLIYSASNRNEYQESSCAVKRSQNTRLTTPPSSVSRLSRKCGILDVSQHYRTSYPDAGIALLYFTFYFYRDNSTLLGLIKNVSLLLLSLLGSTEYHKQRNPTLAFNSIR
jgi:hypothetical protein